MVQNLRSLLVKEAVENYPIVSKSLPNGQTWVAQATCYLCLNNSFQENCCLAWIVPAGATRATFEIWGSGGSGGGSACCMVGAPGASGAYSKKTINVTPGDRYCTCFATATLCSTAANGCAGTTTFVQGTGLTNFCAEGGPGGLSVCPAATGTFTTSGTMAQAYGGDINVPGVPGCHVVTSVSNYCLNKMFLPYPGGLVNRNGGVVVVPNTGNGYQATAVCQAHSYLGWAAPDSQYVPGVGGATFGVFGGTCACGYPGRPGLVRITWE